jgi:hypothetical protein
MVWRPDIPFLRQKTESLFQCGITNRKIREHQRVFSDFSHRLGMFLYFFG